MHAPSARRIGNERFNVFGQNQHRQDSAHPAGHIAPQEPRIVFFQQSAQSPVANGANDHAMKCTVSPYTLQVRLHGESHKARIRPARGLTATQHLDVE